MGFLPVTKQEMDALGWEQADFVYVNGDAYVDHPSFGASIITRVLENEGFRIAVLPQPDWHSAEDFKRFGCPRLGFLVSSGNIDSMVAHYTAAKKRRNDDAYSPGGKSGFRPDRAIIVYCNRIREAYGKVPILIGGLEASLRRFAHYDYWSDSVRRSVLFDSGADILMYGMGERSVTELAHRLDDGENVRDITDVRGTCYVTDVKDTPFGGTECPSYENVCASKKEYAIAARIQQDEQDHIRGKTVKQRHGNKMLIQNPPSVPLNREELDRVYSLPYMRRYHPMYVEAGGIPAINEVQFSITHNRGCFGGCSFCSIAFHQGRYVTSRSKESIVSEAKLFLKDPEFKGYIHDVGGPTANFRYPSCDKQEKSGLCKGKRCLAPTVCPALKADHSEYLDILRTLRGIKGIKKVFIRSGIRYDYILRDGDDSFFKEMVAFHVSGQLKVAPEHCSERVLDFMGKPHIQAYSDFSKRYFEYSGSNGKQQYLVPYLMSSHPGSDLSDAIELALFLKKRGIRPRQVQDFYPTPGTISTAMFYSGLDPYSLRPVYTARSPEEKAMQRALLQYFLPENKTLILKALKKAGRYDLIGTTPKCLINDSKQNDMSFKRRNNNVTKKKKK